ncbi:aminotransferase class I/II-fold pyridoxal phosphate-dependent enzyme [Virgibacillus dakarensis]|uniref:Aminotransferase n=1 Tax=Lentibacillus populi TaxID=1827502 RepID=A0A9W5TZR2_9BACI|nr:MULTISPECIES: aminotransferase class I/II-fold pyridoxal phosphate-dependent enzyme [Bacillaceae]MBT2218305.1 aminotransferase class I/II-fold pyridoxal phosphate-dependent enzyme [Virgibacillus dakarensis]MTW87858.1 aminotransferase class I/II-fold pyridoxal phosphate-dependent enzyme [Virgibacillus dakarensis]GGB50581.1 LL-diaminopimelate aminotransferase [Lentibacillus populi]
MTFVSDKVTSLPPYLFAAFQEKKKELEAKGVNVIDLGIGAPDLPTPDFIIDKLAEEARVSANHRYSTYSGCLEFREAVSHYYQKHYGVTLDPDTEVLALIGSKEGIANLMHAVINPGETVLVPDPGYPAYRTAVHLAGGKSVRLPLDTENGYVPLFDNITDEDKEKATLMLLNYPSNPTAATVHLSTFVEAIAFARENNVLLAHDAAYDLVTFHGYKAPSVMQAPNAKDWAVEFGSLSKSFSMTGWRIGYIVGNKTVIGALATLKSNIDTSQFLPIQKAAAAALESDLSAVAANNKKYEMRMEKLHAALNRAGIYTEKPKGTIFLWARVPDEYTSIGFANKLLEEAGIIVTPGTAFGPTGEGFIRISLSVTTGRLDQVINRIKAMDLKGVHES